MGNDQQIPLTLRQLFNAVCDEIATAEQVGELEGILRSDERARRLYMDYCRLHMRLYFVARVDKMAARAVRAIAATDVIADGSTTREPNADPVPTKSPVLGFLGGAIDYVNHSRMLMFWLMALLVGGWFAFQLGSLVMDRAHRGRAPVAVHPAVPDSQDVPAPPGGSFVNSAAPRQSDSVAFMTTVIDCHWRVVPNAVPPASAPAPGDADTVLYNGEPFHVGSEFSAGQQLDLVRGLAEITFRSGARIILNGPAHFTIGSRLGGKLQIGKLTARVPHEAHGFTVNTPAGKVVDLGTEFGVAVAADHTMNVEVFVGEVAVDSSSDGQTPSSPSTAPTTPQKLTAGHAAHVEAGKPVATIPLDPKRFVRGLGPREDSKVAQAAYLDYVRSLKPAVWFRMEGKPEDRVLHDEMGTVPDAKLHWDGPGNPFVEGRVGKGLWLRGETLGDYAVVPDYPKAEHGKLSVSAWAYADSRRNFARIVANWGGGQGQFHFGIVGPAKPQGNPKFAAEIAQQDGTLANVFEDAAEPFPLYQWQHVAFVADGSTLRLYRRGREVAMAKCTGLKFPVPMRALGIGIRTDETDEKPGGGAGFWSGRLDEIAIFNDALSAEDIRTLAAAPPQ